MIFHGPGCVSDSGHRQRNVGEADHCVGRGRRNAGYTDTSQHSQGPPASSEGDCWQDQGMPHSAITHHSDLSYPAH